MRGCCCLVLVCAKLVQLNGVSLEACALMRDLQAVAAALQEITKAVKLNYEIHGNTLPHLSKGRGSNLDLGTCDCEVAEAFWGAMSNHAQTVAGLICAFLVLGL
jgi:hypothetical protein